MADNGDKGSRWIAFRRHTAVQAGLVYAGASWAIIEGADIFFPSFGLSLTAIRWLGLGLALGFVVVVGYTWRTAGRKAAASSAGELLDPNASSPPRRRRRRLAYGATVALLVLGGFFWWVRPRILGAVSPAAEVIAVMPFHTSGPGVELLGEGLVDLISPNLDAVGAIRTVDSRTVLHRWRQRASQGSLDLEGALAVGRDVDAGSILWGTATSAGSEVRLSAELYTLKGVELASAQADGPADSLLALVDSLTIKLLREIWVSREPVPNLRVSAITTGSVDAIRAYLLGEQYYRRSRWDSANHAFTRAIEADSTFALAHYRLALTYGWSQGHGAAGARRHGQAALRFSDRLPARERSMVIAHDMFEDGLLAAHDTMEKHVELYPDDAEGWYLLGDVRYHARPLLDLDRDDLYSPFDRAFELDPSLAPALIHPIELSTLLDDSATYEGYLEKMRAAAPPEQVEPYALAGAVLWGPADAADSMISRLAQIRPGTLGTVYTALFRSPDLPPDALLARFESDIVAAERSGTLPVGFGSRSNVLIGYASFLASLGRLAEARPVFDTLWAINPGGAGYASLGVVYAGLVDSAYASGPMEALMQSPADARFQQMIDLNRMLYSLTRGRPDDARRFAEAGLAADSSYAPRVIAALLSAGIGWADLLDGDTIAGIEKLRSGVEQAGFSSNALVPGIPIRYQLAVALAARPETRDEGIRRLRYAYWFGDSPYVALTYLWLGQALEQAGEPAGAAEAYAQFIRLWEKADPHLQPRVETARRALERLGGEKTN